MGCPQHTPGPWSVGRMQRSSNFAKDTYAVQGDGTILCRVKGGVTEDVDIAHSNARLMAAAPDLLDALVGLREMLSIAESNASGNPEWEYVSKRVNAARAAIAKATGQ